MIVLRTAYYSVKDVATLPAFRGDQKLQGTVSEKLVEDLCSKSQKLYEDYPDADDEGPFLHCEVKNGVLTFDTWLSCSYNARYVFKGGTWHKLAGRKTGISDFKEDLLFELDSYKNYYIKSHDSEDVRYISDIIDLVDKLF